MNKKKWFLFLDRDGVINVKKPNGYIENWSEFTFIPGVLSSFQALSSFFDKIFIVTNQQGIGKGIMSVEALENIHFSMKHEITKLGGRIDNIYYCPDLASGNPLCRKPEIGMGLSAKKDFPEIDFKFSVMVGDSITDIEFGKKLGMKTVFISESGSDKNDNLTDSGADFVYSTLAKFTAEIDNLLF